MNKSISRSDIIETLANKFRLEQKTSELAIKIILTKMTDALAAGDRIEIRRFGSFEIRERAERIARNPKTGVKVSIPKQHSIHFKPGQPLREKINFYVQHNPLSSE